MKFILFAALSASLLRVSLPDPVVLPPLYFCEGKSERSQRVISACPDLCDFSWNMEEHKLIEVFNQVKREEINLVECHAYEDVRTESESYLFSKTEEIISSVRISPSLEKCKQLREKYCAQYDCHYSEMLPPADFSWGKEKINSYERYVLTSHTRSTVLEEGVLWYMIIGRERALTREKVFENQDQQVIYLWDDIKKQIKDCPLARSKVVVAYPNKKENTNLWVPDMGITLNLTSQKFIDSRCLESDKAKAREIIISKQGVLLGMLPSPPSNYQPSRTIIVSDSLGKNEKLILNSMNTLEMIKSKESCLSRCYLIDSPGMHVLGIGGVFTSRDHQTILCQRFVTGEIESPARLCQLPKFMISLQIEQSSLWWDPEEPVVNTSVRCHQLMRKLPRTGYTVGSILINSSGVYLLRSHLMSKLHPDAFSQTHLLDFITSEEINKVDFQFIPGKHRFATSETKSHIEEEYDNWLSSAWGWVKKRTGEVGSWIGEIGDEIRVFFLVVGLVVTIWIFSILYRVIKPLVASRANSREMVEMEELVVPKRGYRYVRRMD
ncbi:TPA_asm: G [Pentaphragma betacytorhabdovirus 1]|nr:TPA_asm: G [Pentaphragma betacytorhabdovirus 1]